MTVVSGVALAAPARAGARSRWPDRSPMRARPAHLGRPGRVALVTRAGKKKAAPAETAKAPAVEEAPVDAPDASARRPAPARRLRPASCVPAPPAFSIDEKSATRRSAVSLRPLAPTDPSNAPRSILPPPLPSPVPPSLPPTAPLPMPPTAGAPGQQQQYQGYHQAGPPQGYYQPYPPPPAKSSGTPGWMLVGLGVALAVGGMKVMEFLGGKKGDMQSMMMQQMMKQAMKQAGGPGAPGGYAARLPWAAGCPGGPPPPAAPRASPLPVHARPPHAQARRRLRRHRDGRRPRGGAREEIRRAGDVRREEVDVGV